MEEHREKPAAVDIVGLGVVSPEGHIRAFQLPPGAPVGRVHAYSCPPAPGAGLLRPDQLRRLGRAQQMALAASQSALKGLESSVPSTQRAVCVGTGLGMMGDTTDFIDNMILRDEREPKPTCFANSVHNSAAAQIAIALRCEAENHTFSHGPISFELALWQALRIVRRGRAGQAILCGVDELNKYVLGAEAHMGGIGADPAPLLPLQPLPGGRRRTLAGEGAAAFVLAATGQAPAADRIARLDAFALAPDPYDHRGPVDIAGEVGFISTSLAAGGHSLADVGFILCGANGDGRVDDGYRSVIQALGSAAGREFRFGAYKHLCGDYCTSSAIGLAVAVSIVRDRRVPAAVETLGAGSEPPSNVLLYHVHRRGCHSVCLVSR